MRFEEYENDVQNKLREGKKENSLLFHQQQAQFREKSNEAKG
jgi:hypothetical protein